LANTRDQIIEKTCDLLELQGYHATGVNQIIRESGSPKGSLYYHFPGGKEEIATEAVRHVGKIVLRNIREQLAKTDDPAESVSSFVQFVARNVALSEYRAGGPITTVAMETAATNEGLRAACHEIYTAWAAAFADRLEAGTIPAARAARLSLVIIAMLEGGIILARTGQDTAPLEAVAEEVRTLVMDASA